MKIFNELSKKIRNNYDNYLILALLIVDTSNNYEYFCHKYKTSNIIKSRLQNISTNFQNLESKKFYSENNIKKLIYLSNKNYVKDLLLFAMCINNKLTTSIIENYLNYISNCNIPEFPISGEYLKKYGYKTGQLLGKKLKTLEELWLENNFVINQKMIEKVLGKVVKN